MTFERFASLCAGALLVGALASCGSSSSVPPSDGGVDTGSGQDTGLPPNLDAAADTGSPPSPDSGADSAAEAGGEDSGGDGGACQLPPEGTAPNCFAAFPQVASMVVSTDCMSGSAPQPQGGIIPDGIYDLLIRTEYSSTCPMAPPESATLVICAGQWDWVILYDPSTDGGTAGSTYEYNYSAALGAMGSVALTSQCQSDLGHTNETLGYTYTSGGQLVLISMTGVVSTYAKR